MIPYHNLTHHTELWDGFEKMKPTFQVVLLDNRDYIIAYKDFALDEIKSMLKYIEETCLTKEVSDIKIKKWDLGKPISTAAKALAKIKEQEVFLSYNDRKELIDYLKERIVYR